MKDIKDVIIELDMIHDNLHFAMEGLNNNAIKSKIGNIKKQVSVLMDEIEDIINAPQNSNKQNSVVHHTHKQKGKKHFKGNVIKENQIHYAHQGRNAIRNWSTHNAQGKFKYSKDY